MHGDKKNPYKAVELLYRASSTEAFIDDLKHIRQKHNIPPKGLKSTNKAIEWAKANPDTILLNEALKIAKKYTIPPLEIEVIREYILYGENKKWTYYEEHGSPIYFIDPTQKLRYGMDNLLEKSKTAYALVMIPDHTSKHEAVEYLSREWKEIQRIIKNQGKNQNTRIRKTIHKDRNQLVKKLVKKSAKQLKQPKNVDKQVHISKAIKKAGYGKIEPEQIRSIPYKKYKGSRNK